MVSRKDKRKLDRPGSGVAPRDLDDIEREIVRADMKYLIEKEKENGKWEKWVYEQRRVDPNFDNDKSTYNSYPTVRPDAISITQDVIEARFTSTPVTIVITVTPNVPIEPITAEIFERCVGRAPEIDDLERCNCEMAGTMGHTSCGWCSNCQKPRFMCMGH
jgi:hypothetical protein